MERGWIRRDVAKGAGPPEGVRQNILPANGSVRAHSSVETKHEITVKEVFWSI